MPPRPKLPAAVLFCCTNNAIRSPMAAGLTRHFWGRGLFVDSVGVHAGGRDPFAIEAMAQLGIDIRGHKAKTFDDLVDTSFDLVVSLSPEAQHSAVELTRATACDVEYWPTFDPSLIEGTRGQRLDAYARVRDQLLDRLKVRFGPFLQPAA